MPSGELTVFMVVSSGFTTSSPPHLDGGKSEPWVQPFVTLEIIEILVVPARVPLRREYLRTFSAGVGLTIAERWQEGCGGSFGCLFLDAQG